jgi:GNAT superfamily N-acetyltransferase
MDELALTIFDTDDGHRATVLRTLACHMNDSHRWSTGGVFRQLFVSLCASDGTVCGGVLAYTHGEWLEVEFVWVSEALRRQGFGTEMLAAVETEARERGCRRSYLDTGCSAVDVFFRSRGYRVTGELPNYHSSGSRFWMMKSLV